MESALDMAVTVFLAVVGFTLGLAFYMLVIGAVVLGSLALYVTYCDWVQARKPTNKGEKDGI